MARNTHLGFGTAVALLISVGVVSYASLDAYRRAERQSDHTLAVLAALDRVLQVAVEVETATRGFVVTGEPSFLADRRTQARAAPEAVAALVRLTADSADQHERAVRLGQLISEKLTWTDRITATRAGGFDGAKELMATARGREIMNEIRRLCERMRAEERAVLRTHGADAERRGRAAKVLTVLGSSLALLLVLAATIVNLRERVQRKRAEGALQGAHDELERHVQERTAQLGRSTRALRMLRSCNQILIGVSEEPALLEQICRTMVETGGYRLAWVGCSQLPGASVIQAQAGEDAGFLRRMHPSLEEAKESPCPCGRAVRTLAPVVVNDVRSDAELAPKRHVLLEQGHRAVAAFPLLATGTAVGVLSVYASEPNVFDADEVNLLQDLADDVALGLRLLRLRRERDEMQAHFIAAQKKTADRLAAEKERLAVTLRSMGDGLIATDVHGRITLLNEVGEWLTGWKEEQALGQRLDTVFRVVDETPAAEPNAVGRVPVDANVLGVVMHAALVDATGATKPVEYRTAPLCNRRGDMEGMVLVFRDYREQRRAALVARRYDRALRTLTECNEALMRTADERSLLGAICRIVVDVGGYRMCWVGVPGQEDDRRIMAVAHAGHEEGYLSTIDVVWSDNEHGQSPVGTAIRTGQCSIVRDIATDPHFGPWREEALKRGYASAAALPLLSEGAPAGALAIYSSEVDSFDQDEVKLLVKLANDLGFGMAAIRGRNERNTLTAALMQADRMAATGVLAAGVAHEINNPLAYVQASLDYVTQQFGHMAHHVAAEDRAELEQAIRDARDGAVRIRHIVRDLKTFSRVDDERKEHVDPRKVIDSSANMAFAEIKHRARLVKDYGKVPLVYANESRLGQVFLNLLINAAQAIPEGRVTDNEIRVVTRTDEDHNAVVEVHDTGTGIPEEVMARIFDPFFTTKPIGFGTGLGLSICHGIIASLGGRVSVKSSVGHGTVFGVVLPAAPAEHAGVQRASAEPPRGDGRRGRILVVDDEQCIGVAIRRVLSDEHDVITLTNAREAREMIARGERYDAILCDLMMPEMTGMELHSEFVSLAPDQAKLMLFLSGGVFTPRAKRFLDEVPNLRIEKPFDAENLRTLVRSVVN